MRVQAQSRGMSNVLNVESVAKQLIRTRMKRHRTVPEQLTNGLWVHPLSDQNCHRAMSEIMQAQLRQAGRSKQRLEPLKNFTLIQGRTDRRGEHKVPRVSFPPSTRDGLFLFLRSLRSEERRVG